MLSSLIVLFISTSSFGKILDFPKGCLSDDENLQKACQALGKIKNSDKLVFATGEKMSGCFLQTKSESSRNESKKFLGLAFQMNELINSRFPSAESKQISLYLNAPDELLNLKDLTKSEALLVQNYSEALKISLQSFTELNSTAPANYFKEYEESREALTPLLQNLPTQEMVLTTIKKLNATRIASPSTRKGTQIMVRDLACKPYIDAFFSESQGQIGLSESLKYLPKISRITMWGHEHAHSFDACYATDSKKSFEFQPFSKLMDCLRYDVGQFSQNRFPTDWCAERHTREAFCDHFGIQAAIDEMKKNPPQYTMDPLSLSDNEVYVPPGFEILFYYLDSTCSELSVNETESTTHPDSKRRLQDILLRHPTIAKAVNCPTDRPYCDPIKGTQNQGVNGDGTTLKTTPRKDHAQD